MPEINIIQLVEFARKYGEDMQVIDDLFSYKINGRFMLKSLLAKGEFGLVFQGIDLQDSGTNNAIILKMTQNHQMSYHEFGIMSNLKRNAESQGEQDLIASVISEGTMVLLDEKFEPKIVTPQNFYEQRMWSFLVMQQYGANLQNCIWLNLGPL